MLAARELNVDKLPESSRNWINEKLIYTHGYGITMIQSMDSPRKGSHADSEQHAGPKHGAQSHRDPARDLFWRAHQH